MNGLWKYLESINPLGACSGGSADRTAELRNQEPATSDTHTSYEDALEANLRNQFKGINSAHRDLAKAGVKHVNSGVLLMVQKLQHKY